MTSCAGCIVHKEYNRSWGAPGIALSIAGKLPRLNNRTYQLLNLMVAAPVLGMVSIVEGVARGIFSLLSTPLYLLSNSEKMLKWKVLPKVLRYQAETGLKAGIYFLALPVVTLVKGYRDAERLLDKFGRKVQFCEHKKATI